jgi:SDR family mycofactocin-dependent oxidoreductase
MTRLANRVVFVTGAARGLGKACALRLADEGAALVLADIGRSVETVPYPGASGDQLETTAREARERGARVVTAVADVRDGGQLARAVEEGAKALGPIDGLVAAAGIDSWGKSWELTDAQWDAMLAINLGGVWKAARAVAPAMIERRYGSMVFISSVLGHKPNVDFAHYTAAKHGVVGLARNMALELAPYGIRVNTVDPTSVNTDMIMNQLYLDRAVGHQGATIEEAQARLGAWNALPIPWIEPVDVANAVLFLLSDEARYVTGVSLPVDAGAMLK